MRFQSLDQWLAWQETLHPRTIDLGLERVRRTLEKLQWRRPAAPIITIGGTNGKGSCAALSEAILRAQGHRVGVFTSPHLMRYNERIRIDGAEATDEALCESFAHIDAARGDDTLTFFEFNTLAALLLFEQAALDAIVLEVGLGGRLDAVNVIDADVALVTSIALDHCEWLGPDRERIGHEKAGIFRAGKPAVFGSRTPPASILTTADSLGASLFVLGRDFDWTREQASWRWRGAASAHDALPLPALEGEIQLDNAAAVLQVIESLRPRLDVSREAIVRGLQTVRLPGRFQRIKEDDGLEWILDVAHNPAAATSLAAHLARTKSGGRTLGVCGILSDKDIEGVAHALREQIDAWIVAGLHGPRALTPAQLGVRLRDAGARIVGFAADVAAACANARQLARAGDRIVVFGSFLTVGPALNVLQSAAAR